MDVIIKIALFIKTYISKLAIMVGNARRVCNERPKRNYQDLYPPKTYRNIGIFMPKQNRISMYYSCMPKYYKFIAEIKEIAA